ncbi:glycosyltransferase family 2 protein [Haladaptatus sp. T7]|uniref:glycosyltransferase family 2 protein n=1 Tax=Haladaptatus sp. T7 TaxID=2029368 RepID=UPI0021A25894|nr:glycosyltransferase family 2 protein [Haladaptatus sp. T7]GKZ15708.1 glycosyl transferase family 2 [Haladaptatus sp. T7]
MDLSVVVPTLNGREPLSDALDAVTRYAPDAEVVVVNGPSADGTSGMVCNRSDVSALVEISDRNLNVARNAGLAEASGEVVAFIGQEVTVEASWYDGIRDEIADGADVVTGPVHRMVRAGMTTETVETRTIAGRDVTYFSGENVAFTRDGIEAVDGFDENLETGGARDCAHRLAGQERSITWSPDVAVCRDETDEKGVERDWCTKYRSLSYRLVKNYGPRLTVFRRTFHDAIRDARTAGVEVASGETKPSLWAGCGKEVVKGIAGGTKDGFLGRFRDRSEARNPAGLSSRADRAVERYDWRNVEPEVE